MAKVSSHFVRGEDSTKFASVLVNFMGKVSLQKYLYSEKQVSTGERSASEVKKHS